MKFLLSHRFNYFDSVCLVTVGALIMQNRWITALILILVGTLVSSILEVIFLKTNYQQDREWQRAAKNGHRLQAIKLCRLAHPDIQLPVIVKQVDEYMEENYYHPF